MDKIKGFAGVKVRFTVKGLGLKVSSIVRLLMLLYTCIKLVLQPAVRALRAVYGQILKKSYGTRTLPARQTAGALRS